MGRIGPRRRLAVATAVAAALGVASFAGIAGAAPAPRPDRPAQSEHERIVAFWTPERVARAVPRDFVLDPATRGYQPAAKPEGKPSKPGGGGGGGDTTTVLGASWNGGGEVLRTTGKVLFALGSSYYVCSASVADDAVSGRSIVLTAAHCAYDETNRRFATNWMFVPEYDSAPAPLTTSGSFCAQTKWGCWTASALVVHDGYASAGGFNDQAVQHDFAFAVVGQGGHSGTAQLDATVGSHPVSYSALPGGVDTHLFGYPAAGKYKGNDLVYCRGPLGFDPYTSNKTYRVGCNMTGGSSGGPWFVPFSASTGSGTHVSVNSYGYSGITAMHGPIFNAKTQSVYSAATTANANTIVG
jgi:hypothetical protein